MDAVILAAGENRRLWGTVEPFGKPLVEIGDEPLLVHLVELTKAHIRGSGRIVIVASPQNVTRIIELVGFNDNVRIVIQPKPVGPGDALLRGLEACDSDDGVLVLCGDNVMDEYSVKAMFGHKKSLVVGTAWVKDEREAQRFTRITAADRFVEGPVDDNPFSEENGFLVWLGPLIVPRTEFRKILSRVRGEFRHFRIGPHLNDLLRSHAMAKVHLSSVRDIGTPTELEEAQKVG